MVNVVGDRVETADDGAWSGDHDDARLVVITSGPGRDAPPLVARLEALFAGRDT